MTGLKRGMVELAEHDPEWEKRAAQMIERLWGIFGPTAKEIQHIGSTAIRHIKAKPIVDIAVGVLDFACLPGILPRLQENGIDKSAGQPFQDIVLLSVDDQESDKRIYNIPVVVHNNTQWQNYINFRDYMNHCPKKATAYEKLKCVLAEQYPNDIIAYMNGKKAFVEACIVETQRGVKCQEY